MIFKIIPILILCATEYYSYSKLNLPATLLIMLGFILGTLFMWCFVLDLSKQLSVYKRNLEKNSVSSDENEAKVKVLESKIEVLEKALQNAIDNKN